MGTVLVVYVDQTEYLNHCNDLVVCHTFKPKLLFGIFKGLTRKEAPKARLMTMGEIESDQDPNEDDGDYKNK